MSDPREADRRGAPEEPPPILGDWTRLYALVLIALAAEIAVFWALTRAFR